MRTSQPGEKPQPASPGGAPLRCWLCVVSGKCPCVRAAAGVLPPERSEEWPRQREGPWGLLVSGGRCVGLPPGSSARTDRTVCVRVAGAGVPGDSQTLGVCGPACRKGCCSPSCLKTCPCPLPHQGGSFLMSLFQALRDVFSCSLHTLAPPKLWGQREHCWWVSDSPDRVSARPTGCGMLGSGAPKPVKSLCPEESPGAARTPV